MRILYTLNSTIPGGMERHVLDLVKFLVAQHHEVHVMCPQGTPYTWFEESHATVISATITQDFDSSYQKKLVDYVINNKIDLVHSHELKAGANTLLALRHMAVPVVTHIHTPISEWRIPSWKRFLNKCLYSYLVNKFGSKEIALTQSRMLTKVKEGISTNKLIVIPNGFDPIPFNISPLEKINYSSEIKSRYGIGANSFVFGYVARLSSEKGHGVLLRAFKRFLDSDMFHKNVFHLILAGGGPLESELKSLAQDLGISDKVIFTGIFPPEDLVKFYSTFDIFVFPSLAEGFGLVLMEALYSETPTICSDLLVLKEVGSGYVSYFKTGDPSDLSEKMVTLYHKEESSVVEHTSEAKSYVEEQYSMERFGNSYINLYRELIKES